MKSKVKALKNSSGHIYVTVYYDFDLQATVDVWTGPFETVENFKKGLELVLENIRDFRPRKWLADISMMEGNFEFTKEYIPRQIIPKAMEYGLQCEALVLPHNIFTLLSVQETHLDEINHFELRMFATVNDAKVWLTSKIYP
jgi:hypothetical protein